MGPPTLYTSCYISATKPVPESDRGLLAKAQILVSMKGLYYMPLDYNVAIFKLSTPNVE